MSNLTKCTKTKEDGTTVFEENVLFLIKQLQEEIKELWKDYGEFNDPDNDWNIQVMSDRKDEQIKLLKKVLTY